MLRRYRVEIVLVAALVVVSAFYARWEYIPTFAERHVSVAEEKYGFDVGEPGKWFSAWSLGDGQAYALIAVDPTGDHLAEVISEAGYRFARAGYGWATWAVSLGQDEFVPYALAMVGAAAALAVFVVAVRMRPKLGPRSWLMVLNPALFIGLAGDTSEPMGVLLLAVAMAWGSWLASALLGVTRPTFLMALWGRWSLFLLGVSAAGALALYSLIAFGADSLIPAGGRLTLPLIAYVANLDFWIVLLAIAAAYTLAIGIKKRDWVWMLAGIFVLCFGSDVLRDPINAWRAAGLIPVIWAFGPGYEKHATPDSTVRNAALGHVD